MDKKHSCDGLSFQAEKLDKSVRVASLLPTSALYLCTQAGLISAFLSTRWEALSAAKAVAVKSSLHSGKVVYLSFGRGQAALSASEWDVATRAETAGQG